MARGRGAGGAQRSAPRIDRAQGAPSGGRRQSLTLCTALTVYTYSIHSHSPGALAAIHINKSAK